VPPAGGREADQSTRAPGVPGLKRGLATVPGSRPRGARVFGFRARTDGDMESGLDVLIVLDRVDRYAAERERTSRPIAKLPLASGSAISSVFVAEACRWRAGTPPLSGVRADAVPA